VVAHQPWCSGLLESTAIGLGEGAAIGSITEGISNRVEIGDELRARIGEDNVRSISTAIDKVQAAATTSDAYMCYGTAAFFIVNGFGVWAADEIFGRM